MHVTRTNNDSPLDRSAPLRTLRHPRTSVIRLANEESSNDHYVKGNWATVRRAKDSRANHTYTHALRTNDKQQAHLRGRTNALC